MAQERRSHKPSIGKICLRAEIGRCDTKISRQDGLGTMIGQPLEPKYVPPFWLGLAGGLAGTGAIGFGAGPLSTPPEEKQSENTPFP